MPFLRVVRDKRGYETTYLMHWFRDGGGRQQSRILYAFRSPGGVRVGRSPLEPDVLREIEARHPDIHFDWNTVLGNQQVIESAPEVRRPRRRPPVIAEPAPVVQPPAAPVPQAAPAASPAAPARPPIPSVIAGETADERVAFLTQWHGDIVERITQRGGDPERQAAMLALAARLDPSGWTDADQTSAGLGGAAEALEQLSRMLGRRRRRSRRGRRGTDGSGDSDAGGETEAGGDAEVEASGEEPGEPDEPGGQDAAPEPPDADGGAGVDGGGEPD